MGYGHPPCGQTDGWMDRQVSKHYLPVVLRTRAVIIRCKKKNQFELESMSGNVNYSPKCKQWDHLTFAFLIPEDRDGIEISSEVLIENLQILGKKNQSDKNEMEVFLEEEMSRCTSHRIWDIIPLFAKRFNTIFGKLLDIAETNLKKFSSKEIKQQEDKIKDPLLKFWDIIEINLPEGKSSEMRDQI